MVGGELYTVLLEGFRALFLIVVPITVTVAIAGSLAGILQTATSITDVAIGYAFRLLVFALVVYLFLPAFSSSLIRLAELAFR